LVNAHKKWAPRCQPESPNKELGYENQPNNKPEDRRQEALKNLERFTDQLTVMAHWFEQLKAEISDVNVFTDSEKFDSLVRRVGLFCEAADTISYTLGRRQ
jgi:hypothetical protein